MTKSKYYIELTIFLGEIKDEKQIDFHKYFHLKTIENFVIHFDELNYSVREDVYKLIIEYLNVIKDINIKNVKNDSIELYRNYVYPIAIDYYSKIGFVPYAKNTTLFTIFFLGLVVMLLFELSVIWHIGFVLIFMIHHIRLFIKKNKNIVFGYRY